PASLREAQPGPGGAGAVAGDPRGGVDPHVGRAGGEGGGCGDRGRDPPVGPGPCDERREHRRNPRGPQRRGPEDRRQARELGRRLGVRVARVLEALIAEAYVFDDVHVEHAARGGQRTRLPPKPMNAGEFGHLRPWRFVAMRYDPCNFYQPDGVVASRAPGGPMRAILVALIAAAALTPQAQAARVKALVGGTLIDGY